MTIKETPYRRLQAAASALHHAEVMARVSAADLRAAQANLERKRATLREAYRDIRRTEK